MNDRRRLRRRVYRDRYLKIRNARNRQLKEVHQKIRQIIYNTVDTIEKIFTPLFRKGNNYD